MFGKMKAFYSKTKLHLWCYHF